MYHYHHHNHHHHHQIWGHYCTCDYTNNTVTFLYLVRLFLQVADGQHAWIWRTAPRLVAHEVSRSTAQNPATYEKLGNHTHPARICRTRAARI
jgi:hypothetical protein